VKRFHIKRTVQEEAKWKQLKAQAIAGKEDAEASKAAEGKKSKKSKSLLERL